MFVTYNTKLKEIVRNTFYLFPVWSPILRNCLYFKNYFIRV